LSLSLTAAEVVDTILDIPRSVVRACRLMEATEGDLAELRLKAVLKSERGVREVDNIYVTLSPLTSLSSLKLVLKLDKEGDMPHVALCPR
jgi:hypothetical protein